MKCKIGLLSPQPDDQPCDLRLFTPATCLIELRAAAAVAAASAGCLTPQQAATAMGNSQPTAATGQAPVSQQLPFIKGLGLISRSALQGHSDQLRERKPFDHLRSPSGLSSNLVPNPLSPLSMTPIPPSIGGAYSCSRCGNSYARPHSLNRHIRFECGVEPKFECPVCHKKSKHKHNLVLHMRTHQHR